MFGKKVNKNNIAIIHGENEYNYGFLINRIKFFDNFLKNNSINSGEVIIINGNYSIDAIALFFSLKSNKNIVVPIISSNQEELNRKITISNASKLIDVATLDIKNIKSSTVNNEMLLELKSKNNSGLILFSSGSSGEPKAMLHNLDNMVSYYKDVKSRSLIFLVFLMFDHIGGLNTMLSILSMGSTMIIPDDRNPENIGKIVERYKVNILPTSPSFLNLMLISKTFDKFNFSSVIMITYGTEPMPQSLLTQLRQKLKRTKFLQTFGTSETGIIKTSSKSSDSLLIKFDDPNQQIKVVDGELWIKSDVKVSGYLNHENTSFTRDGWFKTGDLVEAHEGGYYKIKGRKSEVINIGGEKVLPIEVENTILSLDFVRDVTIFSEENFILGQIMIAKVVKDINISNLEAKKIIRDHCKKNLDKFKVPSKIFFEDDFKMSDRLKKIRRNIK